MNIRKNILLIVFFILFSIFLGAQKVEASSKWLTTYYGDWSIFPPTDIPWSKYTHVILFAGGPCATGDGTVCNGYFTQTDINAFIAARPVGKKALVSLGDQCGGFGGCGGGSSWVSATSPANIDTFVANIANFVSSNGFDGVDLDWESYINVSQYISLINKLRDHPSMSGKVIATAAGNWGDLYQVALATHPKLDQINIMCYDMDGEPFNWHNNALFQNGDSSKMACDWRMRPFVNAGVPKAKLGIGFPFYVRLWSSSNPIPLQPGTITGYINYNTLVTNPLRWQESYKRWDDAHAAEYLSIPSRNEFISYGGTRSAQRISDFVKSDGYGGVMTFILAGDYFANETGDNRFPLSSAFYTALNSGATTPTPDTSSPSIPTGLSSSNISLSTINLSWNASSDNVGVSGYNIYRGGNFIASVSGTTYQDTNLTSGASYSYTVSAYDASGNVSSQSSSISATTLSNNPTPVVYGTNLALGKVATTNGGFYEGSNAMLTDGNKNTDNYIGVGGGMVWMRLDLGNTYALNGVKLWHYFGDGRTFRDVVVQVSTDPNFASGVTTVFNNDTDNTLGLGYGTSSEYPETSAGKTISFATTSARYVRFWSNGNSSNQNNYYVEAEVYGSAITTVVVDPNPSGGGSTGGSTGGSNGGSTGGGSSFQSGGGGSVVVNNPISVSSSGGGGGGVIYTQPTNTNTNTLTTTVYNTDTVFSHWKFDEISGIIANNFTRGSSTAILKGPVWKNTGCKISNCLDFDGINDYAFSPLNLSGTSAVTISFWMNWDIFSKNNDLAMEFSPNYNKSQGGFIILPNSSSGSFYVGLRGNKGYNGVLFKRPTAGVWHHYVFVFDKSAVAKNEITSYVDGVPVIQKALGTLSNNTNGFVNSILYFMARGNNGKGSPTLFGAGSMDDVRVYKKTLSADDIKMLYQSYQVASTSGVVLEESKNEKTVLQKNGFWRNAATAIFSIFNLFKF